MAGLADIDVEAAVRKYLEQDPLVDREDESANQATEVEALLGTVALSFLLYPQVALNFLQRAKNSLLQVAQAELQLLDHLAGAFADLGNGDEPIGDTSDLVEAQTALVELDRLGRLGTDLQAYTRYEGAVQRFLDQQLAGPLKRHGRHEFERSGNEAREDLFQDYAAFGPVHASMIGRLQDLAKGLTDFSSVDLTRKVSTTALTRVRSSLQQIKDGLDQDNLSKTVAAIELLSGSAALRSLTRAAGVTDPCVRTGSLPLGRTITAAAEQLSAQATTDPGPWTQPVSHQLELGVDDLAPTTLTLPAVAFLLCRQPSPANFVFTADSKLYLAYSLDSAPEQLLLAEASIAVGSYTPAAMAALLDAAFTAFADCSLLSGQLVLTAKAGTNRLLVLGTGAGSYAGGAYVPPDPSAHTVLGFVDHQASTAAGMLGVEDLLALVPATWATAVIARVDQAVRLSSPTTGVTSQLQFGADMAALGLSAGTVRASPTYLVLQENGADLDPGALGIFVGSRVQASGESYLDALVTKIEGVRLKFAVPLPRSTGMVTTVTAPLVIVMTQVLRDLALRVNNFATDARALQVVLSPLMGQPSQAQLADATRVVAQIRTKLEDLIGVLDVPRVPQVEDGRQQYASVADDILASLEERQLDQAVEALTRGLFSTFFTMDHDTGSGGTAFLGTMEAVGQNELATTTDEDEMDRGQAVVHENPSTQVFPDTEVSE